MTSRSARAAGGLPNRTRAGSLFRAPPESMTKPTADQHALARSSRMAGVLPWLAVLSITLSGLYIRLTFARWPRVYRDSPVFPFTDTAALIAVLAASSWPAMVIVALLLPIVRATLRARPVLNRWVFSSCIGAALLYVLCARDPYGFLEWALD